MVKVKNVSGIYGKQKVIENYKGLNRLYVKRTNVKTYVVYDSEYNKTLDSMVDINGEYHFSTLKELNNALNA